MLGERELVVRGLGRRGAAATLLAGADGYLVKKDVESGKLLELVKMLLPARA